MEHSPDLESIYSSLQEIVWHFGTRRLDGKCFDELSQAECRCLRFAARLGECAMGDLANALGLTPSGATRVADRLEDKGYLCRIANPVDGRICCIRVASKGLDLIEALETRVLDDLGAILKRIPEPMNKVLDTALSCLATAIRQSSTLTDI